MTAIYLDYNATTPIDPRVAQAMSPYIHPYFGNPSSAHEFGRTAPWQRSPRWSPK